MIAMLHGLIGSPSNWTEVKKEMASSDGILWNPYLDYMEPTENIIRGIEDRIITYNNKINVSVGNSLGCYISLMLADKFDSIILVSPPYKFSKGSVFLSKDRTQQLVSQIFNSNEKVQKVGVTEIKKKWRKKLRNIESLRRLKSIKNELVHFDFKSKYKLHQNKIHFVLGANDQITPFKDFVKFISKESPKATIDAIDDCGHAIPIEKPVELAMVIRKYIPA